MKLGFGQDFEVEAFESDLLVRALSVPKRKSKTTFFRPNIPPISGENGLPETTLKWFSHPCTFFFSKSSNGPILKFWILKKLCDMYPKMWNITLEHFPSLDAVNLYRFIISPIDNIINWYYDQLILTNMSTIDIYINDWYFHQLLIKKSIICSTKM